MESLRYWPVLMMLCSPLLRADACRLESDRAVEIAGSRLGEGVMVVTVCGHCEDSGPVPLRIRETGFRHFAPERVSIPFYDDTFPVEALEEAELQGSGALAEALRSRIEAEYADETGYLPDDPWLVREKRERYAMLLRFAREDYDMRVWDELLVNGKPVDPAQVYYPVGNDEYRSLGMEVDCDMDRQAPRRVSYTPVVRDAALESPPEVFVADITGQCYDGSCPEAEWTVHSATPVFDRADGEQVGMMHVGETVRPLQTLSHVSGARAVASKDHGHIFEGDVFYLLDSQAEGFFRIWHYGNVFVGDADGVRIGEAWNHCGQEDSCWADAETRPVSIWWSKVRRGDGAVIWVREPLQTLSGVLVD